jgi:hypothetical protein
MVLMGALPPVASWPEWVQIVVIVPTGLLASYMCWIWWPGTGRMWRRFGFLLAYLLLFFAILYFVFGWK